MRVGLGADDTPAIAAGRSSASARVARGFEYGLAGELRREIYADFRGALVGLRWADDGVRTREQRMDERCSMV